MPKYMELVNWIQEQIASENLLPGQKMYSENKLKELFHVSRQTVRHAIDVLESEDIVYRIQGSGTYVNDSRITNLEKCTRIAVVTTYMDSYIFPRIIKGIENKLSDEGYTIQLAFTNNQNGRERTILETILSQNEVAGIIMETVKSGIPNPNMSLYQEICRRKIPIIFFNSYYPQLNIPHVSINDRMAGKRATKYLIEMGHRKIGGVFKLDDGQGHQRYRGFLDAMNEAGLGIDDRHILWVDTEDIKHMACIRDKMIRRLQGCTGVFCYNDEVAFGVMEILKNERIAVPDDISMVSVDDSELAVLGDVKLTSIPHPMECLGEKTAENLVRMIRNPVFDGTYEYDVEIVPRESVRKMI